MITLFDLSSRLSSIGLFHHRSALYVILSSCVQPFIFDTCNIQVNSQVIRPNERMILTRLVDIMVALELRFFQEKADDGQLVYRLDPYVIFEISIYGTFDVYASISSA